MTPLPITDIQECRVVMRMPASGRPNLGRGDWTVRLVGLRIRSIRVFGVAAVTMSLLFGALAHASTAHAKNEGYWAKDCTIPAMVSDGLQGDKCMAYGSPYWVSGKKPVRGAAGDFSKWVASCAEGIVWAVIGIVQRDPKAVIQGVFLGCATNVADAAMFGG
jgi:hypothetical protein